MGGASWATNSGLDDGGGAGNKLIAAYTGYTLTSVAGTTSANYAGNNIDVDNSGEGLLDGPITPNTLRFSTSGRQYRDPLRRRASTMNDGGILVAASVGNNLSTITGGTLTGQPGGSA